MPVEKCRRGIFLTLVKCEMESRTTRKSQHFMPRFGNPILGFTQLVEQVNRLRTPVEWPFTQMTAASGPRRMAPHIGPIRNFCWRLTRNPFRIPAAIRPPDSPARQGLALCRGIVALRQGPPPAVAGRQPNRSHLPEAHPAVAPPTLRYQPTVSIPPQSPLVRALGAFSGRHDATSCFRTPAARRDLP